MHCLYFSWTWIRFSLLHRNDSADVKTYAIDCCGSCMGTKYAIKCMPYTAPSGLFLYHPPYSSTLYSDVSSTSVWSIPWWFDSSILEHWALHLCPSTRCHWAFTYSNTVRVQRSTLYVYSAWITKIVRKESNNIVFSDFSLSLPLMISSLDWQYTVYRHISALNPVLLEL